MFSRSDDVEANALFERRWPISAIARHLQCDRKTVRAYLSGGRVAGVRRSSVPDPMAPFLDYVKARFQDDPHLWASAVYDEVVPLGYERAYPSFARQLRLGALRPHCEACSGVKGRESIEIDHLAGEEIQWDWAERRHAPWGATAYVLLGTLSHSGRTRGVLAESMDHPHLIEAMDGVLRRLGGTARKWRTDRLPTVIVPGTADVQASFAPVAKHYGAIVTPCPPRRGNRKGAVECGVKFMCGRWWRTMTAANPEDAQVSLDHFWSGPGDARLRPAGRYIDPEELATGERPVWPSVDDRASVAFRGNRYSTALGLTGVEMTLRHRLGTGTLDIVAPGGGVLVTHRLATPGAGSMVRTPEHRAALEQAVLGQLSPARPCDRKANKPPGTAALEARAKLLGTCSDEPTVDLVAMAEIVQLAFGGAGEHAEAAVLP